MHAAYDGFRYFHVPTATGFARVDAFDALKTILATREGCTLVPGQGRGGLYRFAYPGGDGFLRVYRRGGFVRHIVSESYVLQNRALAEFKVHHALQARGLPVPPLLGAVWHRKGPVYRGAIATMALQGRDLLTALKSETPPPAEELAACGEVVRRFHDAGLHHADLNAANIFLTASGPYLLDFDRASLSEGPLSEGLREANLARLRRSFQKHSLPETSFFLLAQGHK